MDERNYAQTPVGSPAPGTGAPSPGASTSYGGATNLRPTHGSPFYTPGGMASTYSDGAPLLENSFDAAGAGSAASDPTMLMFGTDESVQQARGSAQEPLREEQAPDNVPRQHREEQAADYSPPGVPQGVDLFGPEEAGTGASPDLRHAAAASAPAPGAVASAPPQAAAASTGASANDTPQRGAPPPEEPGVVAAEAPAEAQAQGETVGQAGAEEERQGEGRREDQEYKLAYHAQKSLDIAHWQVHEKCDCSQLSWEVVKEFFTDFFDGDQYLPAESHEVFICVPARSLGKRTKRYRKYRLQICSTKHPDKVKDLKDHIQEEVFGKLDENPFVTRQEAEACRMALWKCLAHYQNDVKWPIHRMSPDGKVLHDLRREEVLKRFGDGDDNDDSDDELDPETGDDDDDDREDGPVHVLNDGLFDGKGPPFVRQSVYFMLGWTGVVAAFWLAGSLKVAIGDETDEEWPAVYGGLETYYPGGTSLRTHDQCTKQNAQLWRWWTYQFTHTGWRHIGMNSMMNIALGTSMERWQGSLRMGFFFNVGVIGGACCTVLFDCHASVVGCSGGCYSLVGLQVSDLIMNFRSRWRRPVLFTVKVLVIIFLPLLDILSGPDISHTAHWGGMLAGLLIGVSFGFNKVVLPWEEKLAHASMVMITFLFLFTLIWTTAQWPPRSLFSDEHWCFKQQVSNYPYFGDSEWHCVRGYTDAFVGEWSAPNQAHANDVSAEACDDVGWDLIEA